MAAYAAELSLMHILWSSSKTISNSAIVSAKNIQNTQSEVGNSDLQIRVHLLELNGLESLASESFEVVEVCKIL